MPIARRAGIASAAQVALPSATRLGCDRRPERCHRGGLMPIVVDGNDRNLQRLRELDALASPLRATAIRFGGRVDRRDPRPARIGPAGYGRTATTASSADSPIRAQRAAAERCGCVRRSGPASDRLPGEPGGYPKSSTRFRGARAGPARRAPAPHRRPSTSILRERFLSVRQAHAAPVPPRLSRASHGPRAPGQRFADRRSRSASALQQNPPRDS